MSNLYRKILVSERVPGSPTAAVDLSRRSLAHIYENVPLETSNFQTEVGFYLSRKETYSGAVATVASIQDEHIAFQGGAAAIQVSVVMDYVPWRLHQLEATLTSRQALMLLEGCVRGFRELLHRVRTPFPVQSCMMGVDGNGSVKVWWNELFFRSNFGFLLNADFRLRDMVLSLVTAITAKMEPATARELEQTLTEGDLSFVILEQRIRPMLAGINLSEVGLSLVEQCGEYQTVVSHSQTVAATRSSVMTSRNQRLSGHQSPTERLILSPARPLEFNPQRKQRLITKRVYRDGTAPSAEEKLKIIKQDIENLREVVSASQEPKLKHARSVGSIVSYEQGLQGDSPIPEVSRAIRESRIVGPGQMTVSRFIQPAASIQENPEMCGVCSQLQEMRMSQTSIEGKKELFLSRLQQTGNAKSVNSTSRSFSEVKLEKPLGGSIMNGKFGESEKKLPEKMYFPSLFD